MEEYDKLKMKSAYSFIIFKLNDALNEIIVDTCGEKGCEYS